MNIKVSINTSIKDGTTVSFRAPADCSEVTGLIVNYQQDEKSKSKEFIFADAHGNNVGDIDNLFAENAVVTVILDVEHSKAYIQNADTNSYLEERFANVFDDKTKIAVGVRKEISGNFPTDSDGNEIIPDTAWRDNKAIGTGSAAIGMGAVAYSRASKSLGYRTQTGYPPNAVEAAKRPEAGNVCALPVELTTTFVKSSNVDTSELPDDNNIKDVTFTTSDDVVGERYNADYRQLVYLKVQGTPTYLDVSSSTGCRIFDIFKEGPLDGSEVMCTEVPSGTSAVQCDPDRATEPGIYVIEFSTLSDEGYIKAEISNIVFYGYPEENKGQAAVAIGSDTVAIGNNSLAGGLKSVASAPQAFAFGTRVEASGDHSIALGSDFEGDATKATEHQSIAIGYGSQAVGERAMAVGFRVHAKEDNQTVIGRLNEDDSEAAFIIGNGPGDSNPDNPRKNSLILKKDNDFKINAKDIYVDSSISNFNANRINVHKGSLNLQPSDSTKANTLSGTSMLTIGESNKSTLTNVQPYSIVLGTGNDHNSLQGMSVGWGNRNHQYARGYVFGRHLELDRDNNKDGNLFTDPRFVVGMYNAPITTDNVFVVASGTSANNRKNALTVNKDGSTLVSGDIYANGNKLVATQEYVDNTLEKCCPSFTENGATVTCEPVEGYPLKVVSKIAPNQEGSGDPSPGTFESVSGIGMVDGISYSVNSADMIPHTLYRATFQCDEAELIGVEVVDGASTKTASGTFSGNTFTFTMPYDFVEDAVIFKPTFRDITNTEMMDEGYDVSFTLQRLANVNIRPISGHSAVKLRCGGKNLIPFPYTNGSADRNGMTYIVGEDGGVTASGTPSGIANFWLVNKNFLLKKGTYTLSLSGDYTFTDSPALVCADYTNPSDPKVLGQVACANGETSKKFTLDEDCSDVRIYAYVSGGSYPGYFTGTIYPQLEVGDVATPYEPYRGEDFTIDFGQTVYGGSFDWNSGVLTIDRKLITLDGTEVWEVYTTGKEGVKRYRLSQHLNPTLMENIKLTVNNAIPSAELVCSKLPTIGADWGWMVKSDGVYAESAKAINMVCTQYANDLEGFKEMIKGAQIVFGLEKPVTVLLTPQEIVALLGTNILYSNTGNTTVTGKADPTAIIEKLTNAIIALGGNI